MVRRASIFFVLMFTLASVSFAADRYYRDVDIPNPDESKAVLRLFGVPAEISVIREDIAPGFLATSRWIYYFVSSRGSVHPISFYIVRGRWEKRDEISKQHYERFRLLQTDSLKDAELILRYKRAHPQRTI